MVVGLAAGTTGAMRVVRKLAGDDGRLFVEKATGLTSCPAGPSSAPSVAAVQGCETNWTGTVAD
jgi:hypothetical protein